MDHAVAATRTNSERFDWHYFWSCLIIGSILVGIVTLFTVGGIQASRADDRERAAVRTEVLARFPDARDISVSVVDEPPITFALPEKVCTAAYVIAGAHVTLRQLHCTRTTG